MYLKQMLALFILMVFSFLTACTSISNKSEDDGGAVVDDRTGQTSNEQEGNDYEGQTSTYNDSDMAQAQASGMTEQMAIDETLASAQSSLLVQTIYFDYDSITINAQGEAALNTHAEFLSLNPNKILIVEGHTDEQGTREYNLALGERRSMSIANFLIASGISKEQLDIRSYGEENPVSLDRNESAWQLNRRVELLY